MEDLAIRKIVEPRDLRADRSCDDDLADQSEDRVGESDELFATGRDGNILAMSPAYLRESTVARSSPASAMSAALAKLAKLWCGNISEGRSLSQG
jgi:hypothetical protein